MKNKSTIITDLDPNIFSTVEPGFVSPGAVDENNLILLTADIEGDAKGAVKTGAGSDKIMLDSGSFFLSLGGGPDAVLYSAINHFNGNSGLGTQNFITGSGHDDLFVLDLAKVSNATVIFDYIENNFEAYPGYEDTFYLPKGKTELGAILHDYGGAGEEIELTLVGVERLLVKNYKYEANLGVQTVTHEEGTGTDTTYSFPIELDRPVGSGGSVAINYTRTGGSATADDFSGSTAGTVIFAAGEQVKNINIIVSGDSDIESDETFNIQISTSDLNVIVGNSDTATGLIINDDFPYEVNFIGVEPGEQEEGTGGNTTYLLPVELDRAVEPGESVTVNYDRVGGSANADDFVGSTSGTLTFGTGEQTKYIHIVVSGDADIENDETFQIRLSTTDPKVVVGSSGTVTYGILNDDFPYEVNFKVVESGEQEEGTGSNTTYLLPVELDRAVGPSESITVNYDRVGGSANADDFVGSTSGTLTFGTGEQTKYIHIVVSGDADIENDETFQIRLSTTDPKVVVGSSGTVTYGILNDDFAFTTETAIAKLPALEISVDSNFNDFSQFPEEINLINRAILTLSVNDILSIPGNTLIVHGSDSSISVSDVNADNLPQSEMQTDNLGNTTNIYEFANGATLIVDSGIELIW